MTWSKMPLADVVDRHEAPWAPVQIRNGRMTLMVHGPHLVLLDDSLYEEVLVEPFRRGADTLRILAGYASPAMVTRLLQDLEDAFSQTPSVELICGMTGMEGIAYPSHVGFRQLHSTFEARVSISYMTAPYSSHAKLYVWARHGQPVEAYMGSANFSQLAFGLSSRGRTHAELMQAAEPNVATFHWEQARAHSIDCDDEEVEDRVGLFAAPPRPNSSAWTGEPLMEGVVGVELPLFVEDENRIHDAGGLNWGQRGTRERDQAYIPVPVRFRSTRLREGFFPPVGMHLHVLTSDGEAMVMTTAQQDGKAIHTPLDNSQIGRYFRERLGVPPGARVELDDLDRFGNRYVAFYRIDDESYFMQFRPR